MALKKELTNILACPKCKGDLIYEEAGLFLVCNKCMLKYPVKDDIPALLVDKAIDKNSQ
jgi:uncharacterized protein